MKTTIASILVFTGLVLYFGVKKPAAVDVSPETSASAETAVIQKSSPVGATEFSQPTTIAPKVAVAAEAPGFLADEAPIDSLSKVELKNEIESLQQLVVRENAITRLNEDTVSQDERAAWGKVFGRLLALRSRSLKLDLEQAGAALQAYKAQHEARVAAYVGRKT